MSKKHKESGAGIETQQARVLGGFTLDGIDYNPNDIIESDPELIRSLGSSVDTSSDAVNYCLGLEKPVIKQHPYNKPQPVEQPETEQPAAEEEQPAA